MCLVLLFYLQHGYNLGRWVDSDREVSSYRRSNFQSVCRLAAAQRGLRGSHGSRFAYCLNLNYFSVSLFIFILNPRRQ